MILSQARTNQTLEQLATPFLNENVPTVEEAWAGARDIVAEAISDHAEVRRVTREKALQWGVLHSEKVEEAADDKRVYELYYEFELRVDKLRPHQVLAINRGESEKVLRVKVISQERDWRNAVEAVFRPDPRSPLAAQLQEATNDAAERLLLPAIERDVRRELPKKPNGMPSAFLPRTCAPCSASRRWLGIPCWASTPVSAPAARWRWSIRPASCWIPPPSTRTSRRRNGTNALETLAKLVSALQGDPDHHRQRHGLARDRTAGSRADPAEESKVLRYLIVNEAGASVYSASPLARAEMPDLDVSLRGAVSIARRAQDPLAELVKIDPKSIGVGMYQHDVDQKQLNQTLTGVVESVVNRWAWMSNTASPALLTYVAGIGPKLAEKIVAHRDAEGAFRSREALRKVPGLGPKSLRAIGRILARRAAATIRWMPAPSTRRATRWPQALLQKAGLSLETPTCRTHGRCCRR